MAESGSSSARCKRWQINVESVPRQGYRLPRAVDLLDKKAISAELTPATRQRIEPFEVLLTVDSTNRYVAEHAANTPGMTHLCVAEVQNAGRGRRGRSWVAPFGSGICMSMGWQFLEAPPTFSALSLAVGVAAVNALRRLGIEGVGLKWPNDLIWQQRKLGGILIEMRGESAGPAQVVIGIGINVHMPAAVRLHAGGTTGRAHRRPSRNHARSRADAKCPGRDAGRGNREDAADVQRAWASSRFSTNGGGWTSSPMQRCV